MIDAICLILSSMLVMFIIIYSWHKLLNKKINFLNNRLYITLIGLTTFTVFNTLITNKFLKIVSLTIVLMLFIRVLFKCCLQKCIITPIFSQVIVMISETIYAILIVLLKLDVYLAISSPIFNLISNICIATIIYIIFQLKIVKRLYIKILDMTDKIKGSQLSIFCVLAILIANVLSASIYYKMKFSYLLFFNIFMTLVCFLIVLYSFKTQNNYNKVSDKYNIAIDSLKDYEDMMTKYRIANHENKNLLLTVRAMILNKEKDIPKYIDSIIEQKYKDNEKLLFETSVIPTGGLRATIYSEILKIKNNNIKYSLNIDKKMSTVDLIELDKNTIIDICKIIGVFIDNAIEEVNNLKRKHIEIGIYLSDNNLNIKVSNNYKNFIDVDKIFDDGYTTKGENHGFGLSLVKNIISKNNFLENYNEINKKVFSQILVIKYKNKKSQLK